MAGERMTPPPLLRADRLWRRLAQAQDATLERELPPAPQVRALRRLRPRPVAAAILTLGAATALVVSLVHRAPAPLQVRVGQGMPTGEMDRVLVADARSDLPLQFSDGSNLTFHAGSSGRMQRLGDDGAEVFLGNGRLEAHVVHADRTLWLVHAGPYRVRVTGTRFSVVWAAGWLDVALFEGSVMIDGAVLGAGVPLRAGQRLTVDRGTVRTEALTNAATLIAATPARAIAATPAEPTVPGEAPPAAGVAAGAPTVAAAGAPAPPAPAAPPATASAVLAPSAGELAVLRSRASDGDWYTLAKQSAYVESFAAAKRAGWTRLCHRLDAHRLLALGDVARYAGVRGRARQAFEALVTRFPRSPLAADASFSLGRLAFEADQSDRAARWFRRYVADWPHGPLADQAVGRLVECALRTHDAEAARGAARAYLTRAPGGPHARLARQVLRDGAGTAAAGPNPGVSP
ncbi:MAG TPA: tetratricopeptide repeat protein [Polyangia bacterium]|jgi:hypothetical protein|nr:tetratricopeptide repeat protein [Polyangia bacterium]